MSIARTVAGSVVVVCRTIAHHAGCRLGQRQLEIIRIRPRIDHEQAGFVRYGFDQFDHLFVRFGRDVLTVHFDDAIALPETGRFCRRCVIHLADVLTGATLFGVQVKPVSVEIWPLHHMTQPGLILRCGGTVRGVLYTLALATSSANGPLSVVPGAVIDGAAAFYYLFVAN
uniref:Uncharacterized protein n=1 Tax=Anopheles culicifacies TaxID=139723 RepID=A0A182MTC9_9DIPT